MTQIDVYADIWCPFTHLGLSQLVSQRDARDLPTTLRVHPWPLEIINSEPLGAEFVAEEIEDLRSQVSPDLFSGFRIDRFPDTTLPALALVESAYAVGDQEGERMSLELRKALFEDGRDISDPNVLSELAAAVGVPEADESHRRRIDASLAEGKRRGVVGSPHFFADGQDFFCPALDIRRVDGHLKITPDVSSFEQFLQACLKD